MRFFAKTSLIVLGFMLAACSPAGTPQPSPTLPAPATSEPTTAPISTSSNIQLGSAPTPAAPSEIADTVFINGQVLIMDEALTQAEALAIKGGRIIAYGTNAEMLAYSEARTRKIDLQGATLMPGFIDPHTHLLNDASAFGMDAVSVQQLAVENGFTTIGSLYTTEDFLHELEDMEANGQMRIRVNAYMIYNTNCGEPVGDWWVNYPPNRDPDRMLWVSGVKVFADGGSCRRVALSYEVEEGSGYGDLFLEKDEFASVVEEAQSIGLQVVIHALGDRAIEVALDGYEMALSNGENPLHHRIDHNAVLRPDLLDRYGELDIVALIFGTYPSCNDFGSPSPEPYAGWEWAWTSLLDANPGLHVAWHGDDPYLRPINPIKELYGLVTRNQALDDGTVCDALPRIDRDQFPVEIALPMFNREAAYALLRQDYVGTLEPGKFADLVLLSANPLAVSSAELPNIEIWGTVVSGHSEYCQEGHERICP